MRRSLQVSVACITVLVFSAVTAAGTYAFHPSPSDLYDLDHTAYYTWGINWSKPAGESIFSATLFVDDINNWQVEPNIMYIHLLDSPSLGVKSYTDNEGGGDAFAGQGLLLTTFTDDDHSPNPPEDFLYVFTSSNLQKLTEYAGNGRLGFGFDPDCHYFNDGITFTINTNAYNVPEPVTALLAAPAFALLRRARNRRLAA